MRKARKARAWAIGSRADAMREAAEAGVSVADIAKAASVSVTTVRRVIR